MRVVLASGSPRRREILKKIYDEFEIITSDVVEETNETEPGKIVEALSMLKAQAVFSDTVNENSEDTIVIGADTIVYYDSEVLLKPKDEEEAVAMLSMLSDRTHEVYTGVSIFVFKDGKKDNFSFNVRTDVTFYYIDKYDISEYVKTGSPLDKAGAYGIQDEFAKHVAKIDGEYNNVVGFPVARVYQELKKRKLV